MAPVRHAAQKQTEQKNDKVVRPEKPAPADPVAGILNLQQTVGNRAVQRMVEEPRPEPDGGVVQRHLDPAMAAPGLGAVGGLVSSAAMLQSMSAQMLSNAVIAQSALSASMAYSCPAATTTAG